MTNPEEIRDELLPSEKIYSDIDQDGVPILDDCDPLDETHQDFTGAVKSVAGSIKSSIGTVREKIQDYRESRKAKQRGEEIKKAVERKEKLKELERERKELEEKKKVKQKEKEIKELKEKIGNEGLLSKLAGVFEPAEQTTSRSKSRDMDKWAVVDSETGAVVDTYSTKSSAKSAADYLGGEYGVYRTEVALRYRGTRTSSNKNKRSGILDFGGLVGSGSSFRKKKGNKNEFQDLSEDLI